jgi:hypothetical protein
MRQIGRHFNLTTVIATFALVFAMSGGALAASRYVISSSKQISPTALDELKGATAVAAKRSVSGGWWSGQRNLVSIPGHSSSEVTLFPAALPVGDYLLNVTAAITSYTAVDSGEVQCKVADAEEQVIQMFTEDGVSTVPSLGELTVSSPEQAQISCTNETGGAVDIQIYANAISFTTLNG